MRPISGDVIDYMIRLQEHFHREPDLSGCEQETERKIVNELIRCGVNKEKIRSRPGVVAQIEGRSPKPMITIRTPIDGLPIQEKTDLAYSSVRPGIMHACGHDAGMAVLLALAGIYGNEKPEGTIQLLFQPAEEILAGADEMLRAGLVAFSNEDFICSFHLTPNLPTGSIGYAESELFAGAENFEILIAGEGGHVSTPHRASDAICAAAEIVCHIPALICRTVDPREPVVLSVCRIEGGTASNVIAQSVKMEGTLRYLNDRSGKQIRESFEEMITALVAKQAVKATCRWHQPIPPLRNDRKGLDRFMTAMKNVFPQDKICRFSPSLAADDASIFYLKAPGVYWLIGTGSEDQETHPLHSQSYHFSAESVKLALLSCCAMIDAFFEACPDPTGLNRSVSDLTSEGGPQRCR